MSDENNQNNEEEEEVKNYANNYKGFLDTSKYNTNSTPEFNSFPKVNIFISYQKKGTETEAIPYPEPVTTTIASTNDTNATGTAASASDANGGTVSDENDNAGY